MSIVQVFPVIAASIYAVLIIVVILNRPLSRRQKLFLAFLGAVATWSISDFLLRAPFLEGHKMLLFRIVILSVGLWGVQLYYFCRAFLGLSRDFGIYLGYTMLVVCSVLAALGLVPASVRVEDGQVHPQFGWWLIPWGAPLLYLAGQGIMTLFRRMRAAVSPEERNKLTYLMCSALILIVFGIPGASPTSAANPVTSTGLILCASVLTYALVKHDLISLSVFLRRVLGWIVIVAICLAVFEAIQVAAHFIGGMELSLVTVVSSTVGTLAVTAVLVWMRSFFFEKIDQLFYRDRYQYRRELFDFVSHKIRGVTNLQELGESLLPSLARALDCLQAFILLPAKEQGDFVVRFSEPSEGDSDAGLEIMGSSPIIDYLRHSYLTKKDLDIRPELRGVWTAERTAINNAGIELLFALSNRGKMVGILALGKKGTGKYSVEDANLAESIANQVAVSLEKEYIQSELAKREKELSIINRLTKVISSSLRIQDVYDTFILDLREYIEVDFATIGIINNNQMQFSAVYNQDRLSWRSGECMDLLGSGLEWLVLSKKSEVLQLPVDSTKQTVMQQVSQAGFKSAVFLPLIAKDEVIGILTLASYSSNTYTSERVQLLEQLASHISTSVANSQLYMQAEQRARIDELTRLANRRHFDEMIDKEINRHFRYGSMLSLVLADVDNFKSFNDLMGHTNGDKVLQKVSSLISRQVRNFDMTFRYGGDEFAMIMPNTSTENCLTVVERIRKIVEEAMRSESIPVTLSLGIAGWPNDGISSQELITAADQALYYAKRTGQNRSCLAAQVLLSSTGNQSLQTQPQDNETLNTIYALAATIEARDRYTYGHSRKVRTYAVALAEALNLTPEKVAVISHAALLHDIGKIGIYDNILNKPGALTTEERDLLKGHPALSRAIVAHIPNLTPCLPAILHHHERWDGKGYPTGLKGEEIPIEARILTIADSFDAMTSARPYRNPMPLDKVKEELQVNAGSQFDPELIDIFIPLALKMLEQYLPASA